MSKRAGRKSQASNDFIEPLKPTITNVAIVNNRLFDNGAVDVSFILSPISPIATSFTVTAIDTADGSGGQTPAEPFTTVGQSSPITVTGLKTGKTYKFTMIASNDIGDSPVSNESQTIVIVTAPQTPNTPTISNNGAETNNVVWTASANDGGSAVTNYELLDDEGRTFSYNATTFSANINDGGNSFQRVRVRARNATGASAYSEFSNQVQTTPFSFAPFGFTPFSFTPFGFTPFGFTPFGFTPKSVGAETIIKSKVPEGLILAHNLSVGDVLYSANIEGIDVSNTAILEYLQNWSSNSAEISQDAETTIVAMAARISDEGAIVINGNKYSRQHFVLIKRNGEMQFQPAADVLQTDLIFSPAESDWVEIVDYKITDQKELLISIDVEPYDIYFTDNALVHDSYRASDDPNALTSSDETFTDKLDAMYQQWRDSQDQQ
jgi:hypothetical protein